MTKEYKVSGELAVGLFIDGRYLRIVCLSRQKDNVRLIDARSLVLAQSTESGTGEEEPQNSIDLTPGDDSAPSIDLELGLDFPEAPVTTSVPAESGGRANQPPDPLPPAADRSLDDQTREQKEIPVFGENGRTETPVDIDFLLQPNAANAFPDLPEFADLELVNVMASEKSPAPAATPASKRLTPSRKTVAPPPAFEENLQDNASLLHEILSRYPARKYKVAISLPDPQTYYTYFNTDWGLNEKKLTEKIIEELSKERSANKKIKTEAISILRLALGNLMVITRDAEVSILNLLETLKDSLENRLPKIAFVESAEISLVNLVKKNYNFPDKEISVIIYVGHEFSRFIFLQGNLLLHISPIMGEGADSFLVFGSSVSEFANTIYSRLLLETDDLNLSKVDNLILAGEAREAVLKSLLVGLFPEKVNIEEIKFVNLDTFGVPGTIVKMLPHTAVALGSAWRALDESNEALYQVNLIPSKIKEEQKIFKLSLFGWILLALIPIFTLFFTKKVFDQDRELRRLQIQQQQIRSELLSLQEIKTQLDGHLEKLNFYTSTYGVLDSLVVGTEDWSQFLNKLARKANRIGGIWITEMETLNSSTILLKGYSMTRAKIPVFCNAIGQATLQQVQVQDIRKQRVYLFTITAPITGLAENSATTP